MNGSEGGKYFIACAFGWSSRGGMIASSGRKIRIRWRMMLWLLYLIVSSTCKGLLWTKVKHWHEIVGVVVLLCLIQRTTKLRTTMKPYSINKGGNSSQGHERHFKVLHDATSIARGILQQQSRKKSKMRRIKFADTGIHYMMRGLIGISNFRSRISEATKLKKLSMLKP